jgi:hypothetical protein
LKSFKRRDDEANLGFTQYIIISPNPYARSFDVTLQNSYAKLIRISKQGRALNVKN